MDTFVCATLKDWNFEDYIEKFKNEEINEEAFKLLSVKEIELLFPKIGPRLRFLDRHRTEFKTPLPPPVQPSSQTSHSSAAVTAQPDAETRRGSCSDERGVKHKAQPGTGDGSKKGSLRVIQDYCRWSDLVTKSQEMFLAYELKVGAKTFRLGDFYTMETSTQLENKSKVLGQLLDMILANQQAVPQDSALWNLWEELSNKRETLHGRQEISPDNIHKSTHSERGGASQSASFEKKLEEIQTLLYCSESKQIFNNVKGEDIIILIGNTRSGKSTLINYVIGNQLKGVKMNHFPFTMYVVKANDQESGPVIGLETVSQTTIPSIWSATRSGLRGKLVDIPGFEDNRGEAQDIANTFYIKEIIRNAKSVKFVLVTDINDIMSQNISNFTNLTDKMHRMIPETRVLHGGIALVFSKEKGNFTVDNICNFFNKCILEQMQFKVEKSLIKYFSDHKEFITFFKTPPTEGPLTGTNIGIGILDIIDHKLRGIPGSVLSDVKPGLSDKSKVFLLQSYADFCNGVEYLDLLEKVKDSFVDKCREVCNASTVAETAMVQLEKTFLKLFPESGAGLSLTNVAEKLGSLCEMCGIESQMDNNNIAVHIKFVDFLDQMLNLNIGEIYTGKFRGTIEIIKNQFDLARIFSDKVKKRVTELEAEKCRREVVDKHNKEMEILVEKMVMVAIDNEERAAAGKMEMLHATGMLIGGVMKSAGAILYNVADFYSSMFISRR